jgi:mono/diheme cytochrome c family protein
MSSSTRRNAVAALLLGSGAVLWAASLNITRVSAQGKPPAPSAATPQAGEPLPVDQYERNAEMWAMQRVGKSGSARGQEIYWMRCWICHNEYTIASETVPGSAAPSLRDLFKRPTLRNGQPVNDQTVAQQIRRGSPRMPAYTTANLTDKDMADLLAYLREKCGTFRTGDGCYDEHNPPPNPHYRAK